MSYTTQSELSAAIPAPHLNDACDDDGDGAADAGVLDSIIAAASLAVDALLAARYAVPFTDPAPAMCREAAFVFAAELIYSRRQIAERNPFKDRADTWRDRLAKIGTGTGSLDSTLDEESGAQSGSAAPVPTRLGSITTNP
jgi:phage gp36-like protein